MKLLNINRYLLSIFLLGCFFSCNDFLDKEPLSKITPENYLNEESQLAAYANGLYTNILPSHGNWSYGTFGIDQHTDNQAYITYDNRYVPGQWKVGQTGGDWYFNYIYSCNYFLNTVLPRYNSKGISGSDVKIKHYIGEIYFLRAYEYFKRYQEFGDFPIITEPLPDQLVPLIEASKRSPRNEVARFILSDLDKAIELLSTNIDSRKTRITKDVALLLKSRVALFEGTWLKYFKGTAFVPNGEGWPGKDKDYNANYSYPSGDIDSEINYFLQESMNAAKQVADKYIDNLTVNTGEVQQSATDPVNPYMDMFGSVDLSGYDEVLLWREYSKGLGITHCVVVAAQFGDYGVGVTRGLVESFLMKNGLPIYANNSGYKGDDNIANVRKDRDPRLSLFLKEPGQKNIIYESTEGDHAVPIEPVPNITAASAEKAYSTGYALRKGGSFYQNQCGNGQSYTGSITFRAVEALLNYIEACYEKNGTIDSKADEYWRAIRTRAGVDPDYNKTITATDMSKEALNDWGAYSKGVLLNPTLYNIRRERRNELMAEGLRYMDLRRWRAMDQMINNPYHIEGIKIWGEMQNWYKNNDGSSQLIYGTDKANVSSPERSMYLRPYEKVSTSLVYNGYKWSMAHYLQPIAVQHFLITASDGKTVSTSPIYQNPGWPTVAGEGAK
jgi:hypothetical protein